MLRYINADVTFQEVPDETTLCINISNCPCHCEGCHSAYLAEDIGTPLHEMGLQSLLILNKGITCVAFMGGDSEPEQVNKLACWVKQMGSSVKRGESEIKVAWYSGRQELSNKINLKNFDFIKLGPYCQNKGGLNKSTTNQVFYRVEHPEESLVDETYKFQNETKSIY